MRNIATAQMETMHEDAAQAAAGRQGNLSEPRQERECHFDHDEERIRQNQVLDHKIH
jgi:hypothetical protein